MRMDTHACECARLRWIFGGREEWADQSTITLCLRSIGIKMFFCVLASHNASAAISAAVGISLSSCIPPVGASLAPSAVVPLATAEELAVGGRCGCHTDGGVARARSAANDAAGRGLDEVEEL